MLSLRFSHIIIAHGNSAKFHKKAAQKIYWVGVEKHQIIIETKFALFHIFDLVESLDIPILTCKIRCTRSVDILTV